MSDLYWMPKMSDVFQPFWPIWGISGNLLGPDGSFNILGLFSIPIWPRTLKKNQNCFYDGNHSFLTILGLKRGLKVLDQIFCTKMDTDHVLRKNFNCINTSNVCLHHGKRCFYPFWPILPELGYSWVSPRKIEILHWFFGNSIF